MVNNHGRRVIRPDDNDPDLQAAMREQQLLQQRLQQAQMMEQQAAMQRQWIISNHMAVSRECMGQLVAKAMLTAIDDATLDKYAELSCRAADTLMRQYGYETMKEPPKPVAESFCSTPEAAEGESDGRSSS